MGKLHRQLPEHTVQKHHPSPEGPVGAGEEEREAANPGQGWWSLRPETPGTPMLPQEVTSRSLLLAPFLNLRSVWATNFSLSVKDLQWDIRLETEVCKLCF